MSALNPGLAYHPVAGRIRFEHPIEDGDVVEVPKTKGDQRSIETCRVVRGESGSLVLRVLSERPS
jgi:hypothetical protein